MPRTTDADKEPFAQKWALVIGVIVYGLFLGAFAKSFDWPISDSVGTWGQFGDYVGGAINPIVGLITIWLLTASLKQSREEMALTRKAMQDAEASQKATEAALRAQITLSEQARDMNNTVALSQYYHNRTVLLATIIKEYDDSLNTGSLAQVTALKELQEVSNLVSKLSEILAKETNRLVEMHNPRT